MGELQGRTKKKAVVYLIRKICKRVNVKNIYDKWIKK